MSPATSGVRPERASSRAHLLSSRSLAAASILRNRGVTTIQPGTWNETEAWAERRNSCTPAQMAVHYLLGLADATRAELVESL